MLEVDVDVGWFAPLARHEAFEEKLVLDRIDRGHPQHEAHARVRGRATPLAQDAAAACFAHDRIDGQEIGRVTELADQSHLVADLVGISGRDVAIEHPLDRLGGELLQRVLRTQAIDQPLVGILIGQLTEIEGASPGDIDAGAERVGIITKAPDHFLR